jgi:hypothetical protein
MIRGPPGAAAADRAVVEATHDPDAVDLHLAAAHDRDRG